MDLVPPNSTPKPRVSLTSRDIKLLHELYDSVALSFAQVGRKVFYGRAKSTILNRLSRLEGAALIRRMRVHGIAPDASASPIKVVFQISRHGIRELSKCHPGSVEKDEPIRLHGATLVHDMLLVDLADALRERFPGAKLTDGRLWKGGIQAPRLAKPDLALELPGTQKPWAVELELTAKSEKRYREIVLRYRLSKDFERVVYVTDQRHVVTRLSKVLDGKFLKLESKEPLSKFVHTSLSNCLRPKEGDVK